MLRSQPVLSELLSSFKCLHSNKLQNEIRTLPHHQGRGLVAGLHFCRTVNSSRNSSLRILRPPVGKIPASDCLHQVSGSCRSSHSEVAGHQHFDFSTPEAFRDKTIRELSRGLVVLKLCSYTAFVDNSLKIMSVSQRLLGQRLFEFSARCTFYGHFIAGNGEVEAKELVRKFKNAGVATILSITAEEDVGESQDSYDEPRYNKNARNYMTNNDLSARLADKFSPVSQLKITSFTKADVMARLSEKLAEYNLGFDNDTPLSVCNLALGLDGKMAPIPLLTEAEFNHLQLTLTRLNNICEHAVQNNIQILVDAEKTNINPGLTLLTLALMMKFNKERPYVWNTYQCYLKKSFDELKKDLQWAEQQGLCFGVKIVRGAYLDGEKDYAEKHQLEDPCHPSVEATSEMYNNAVDFMLTRAHKNPGKCAIIVATHNEESVRKAALKMQALGLSRTSGEVIFGQVLGMADHITYALGREGYLVYKSSPYGPIEDLLPYLARRAQENRSIFKNQGIERTLMLQELKRKLTFR
ncbi:hydroxyproline dehydrogenase-like [Asterias rubens]|uniref:hydroxyproline dehydrogenase-like n=1 Tax=Asterias rubens TaxID=7604 RepID=UPI001454F5D8|nr:hydroxyproline dehydrogenase-like [Asterias rubens]